ncbi:MAG: hypothetical protein H7A55_06020 [Verrucomicrobiaceae bacterium]|nr:hypothetical protein [Verrucomicrobiaceae bacterium]
MKADDPRLLEVWTQKEIPVLFRRHLKGAKSDANDASNAGGVLVKLPKHVTISETELRGGKRNHKPEWLKNFSAWRLPDRRFNELIELCLRRCQAVYSIHPYRPQKKCAPACYNASGFACDCACMGENHGQGDPGGAWWIVSEAFACQWQEKEYACRLLTAKPAA